MWLVLDAAVLRFPVPRITSAAMGFVVGLVAITPACGYVHPGWAMVIGLVSSPCCWGVTEMVRRFQWIDDSLDVFACHGVGGAIGSILTGLFSQDTFAPSNGTFFGNRSLVGWQLLAVIIVASYSAVVTALILFALKYSPLGLRVSQLMEARGLDFAMDSKLPRGTAAPAVAPSQDVASASDSEAVSSQPDDNDDNGQNVGDPHSQTQI